MLPPEQRRPMFYGRRKGKKMHGGRLDALESVLPPITIAGGTDQIAPAALFPFPVRAVHMEIGFGDGEHLLQQAINNPDIGFIGCEPFVNGIAALCLGIKTNNVKNIRLFPDDARLLMARLRDESIDRCYILNSDPWPKTRHHKRRFIQKETLDALHRLLKPGAELRLSSDHPGLAAWQLEKTFFHGGYAWTAREAADWRMRPADMSETRYQKKNMAGHPMTFLNFTRV